MKAPGWYAKWRADALDDLVTKQDQAIREYGVGNWPRFDYSAETGTLIFSAEGASQIVSDIQIVGTTSLTSWLWSWASAHWDGCCIDEIQKVRAFGVENGIEKLTSEYVYADDLNQLGWELTAVAARVLGTVGAYRPPGNAGSIFLLCKSYRFVS